MTVEEYQRRVAQDVFKDHTKSFVPFVVRKMEGFEEIPSLAHFLDRDEVVDVSCLEQSNTFCGHPAIRELVKVKMKDFSKAFICCREGQSHWMLEADLQLYLSQCCLHSSDSNMIQIENLAAYEKRPSFLIGEDVEAINLWANLLEARSTLHYDANHNILVLLEGRKKVFLLHPSLTNLLNPVSALTECHNHSHLGFEAIEEIVRTHSAISSEAAIVELHAGDALFIPDGWWHMVYSSACCCAMNYWFLSPLGNLLSSASNISAYLIRRAANDLTAHKSKSPRMEIPTHQDTILSLQTITDCATQNQALFFELLSRSSLEELGSCWLQFAQQNKLLWIELLQEISPKRAFDLLEHWDKLSNSDKACDERFRTVFDDVFEPCGEYVSQIRATLIGRRDEYLLRLGEDEVSLVLGRGQLNNPAPATHENRIFTR
eukprot:gene6417-7075_t